MTTTNGNGGGGSEKPTSKLRGTPGGRSLSVEQEELINRLVYFQDEFEQPSDDDLKRLSVCKLIFFFKLRSRCSCFHHVSSLPYHIFVFVSSLSFFFNYYYKI